MFCKYSVLACCVGLCNWTFFRRGDFCSDDILTFLFVIACSIPVETLSIYRHLPYPFYNDHKIHENKYNSSGISIKQKYAVTEHNSSWKEQHRFSDPQQCRYYIKKKYVADQVEDKHWRRYNQGSIRISFHTCIYRRNLYIVTDLLKTLLGNGSVNTFQYASMGVVFSVCLVLGSSQRANGLARKRSRGNPNRRKQQ
jgi:hypothetical protein